MKNCKISKKSKVSKKSMKGGLLCLGQKIDSNSDKNSSCELTMIKMIGNNYCYDSVVEAISKIPKITDTISYDNIYTPKIYNQNIDQQWKEGVVVKTIDFQNMKTEYKKKCTYESLYKNTKTETEAETITETDINKKASILRLFFNLKSLKESEPEFAPILVKEIIKPQEKQNGGSAASSTGTPTIISDDYRRTVLSVVVTQLSTTDGTFEDKHYILKMSSNENNIKGYKDEAEIYIKLKSNTSQHSVYKSNNVVQFYGSKDYENTTGESLILNGENDRITFSNEQWNEIFKNTESLNNEGFYILLENTLGYYDYEDYVNLYDDDESKLTESFKKIYDTLNKAKEYDKFFHGDFHNNNVKINKKLNVKLFDFDYSGILSNENGHISKNMINYGLKYNNDLIFNETNKTIQIVKNIDDLQNFLFWFDIFRMWLSTCKTLHKLVNIDITNNEDDIQNTLKPMLLVFQSWYTTKYDHQWHEYFMDNYFYKNIYLQKDKKEDTEVTDKSQPQKKPGPIHFSKTYDTDVSKSFSLSLTDNEMEKTLVVGEKSLLVSLSLSLTNKTLVIDAENPTFILATSNDLKSIEVGTGGGKSKKNSKTNYKKYGKFNVILNDGTQKMRVIWKFNRQFFIKRNTGIYEKIKKKNIKM